jgi:D-3-phosphoglycerate dehydrogenase
VDGTHHVCASTDQAQQAVAEETVRILREYMRTGEAPNVVNRELKSPATRLLTVTHLNRPGVLARVLGALADENINVEEMENVIYLGAKAACARIRLDAEPSPTALKTISDRCTEVIAMDLAVIE